MDRQLFDPALRRLRRDRAAHMGPELFLFERAFADVLDRLGDIRRRFRRALLVGCPAAEWPQRLHCCADQVVAAEPGPLLAAAAGAIAVDEITLPEGPFDLCVALGTLDSSPDIQRSLQAIGSRLEPDSLLIGAIAGNESLPALRQAMLAADRAGGRGAAPHVHPRLDPPTLAALLAQAGFKMPVVDVDRVAVRYQGFDALVRDLRAMGATNLLFERPRQPLGKAARAAARSSFAALADGGRTSERFDLLHFAAWTPAG